VKGAHHRALNMTPDQFHDMRKDDDGAMQEKHADENVLVVDKRAHLPSFCAFTFKEDDPCAAAWIDFWAGSRAATLRPITHADRNTRKRQFRMFARLGSPVLLNAFLYSLA
jgi:hypothetical protein